MCFFTHLMESTRDNGMAGRETAINSNSLAIEIGGFVRGHERNNVSNFRGNTVTLGGIQLTNLVGGTLLTSIVECALGHASFNQTLKNQRRFSPRFC